MNEHTMTALNGLRAEEIDVICECGRTGCNETLTMSYSTYRNVRLHGAWYVVATEHARKSETVVHKDAELLIVTASSGSAPTLPFDTL